METTPTKNSSQSRVSPNISVIVPVYNGEKFLSKCIDSILKQEYRNFELIIIDNNSNDGTKKIINSFKNKDKRVRYVFEKKQALGKARNTGIESAKYDIVAMTDSDCLIPKNWLSDLSQILIEENENIVMGFQYDVTNTFWSKLMQDAEEDYVKEVSDGKYINSFDPKNFIARKNILEDIMFDPNQVYMEDVDFYVRSIGKTKIRFAPEIQVGHCNKSSFKKVVRVNFIRAYWVFRLYKKYEDKSKLKNILLFSGTKKSKIILSPLLAIRLFFTNSPRLALYKIIAGGSWMAGEAYWYFKKAK